MELAIRLRATIFYQIFGLDVRVRDRYRWLSDMAVSRRTGRRTAEWITEEKRRHGGNEYFYKSDERLIVSPDS